MEEIRSWFEVPAIAHYCYLFRAAFDLTEFEIEDFEDALVVDGSSEGTSFIPDLLARLLRGLYRTKDVTSQNYERYLNDLLDYHYVCLEKKDNPVKDTPFKNLPTKKKVEVLYDICHWRLEVDDIQELLKNNEPDQIRVQPIGKDAKGNLYWYFYGTCLYKEEPLEKGFSSLNGLHDDNGKGSGKMKGKKRKKKGKGRKIKSGKKKRKDKWYSDSDSDFIEESLSDSSGDSSFSPYKASKKHSDEATGSDADYIRPYQCSTKWALACSSTEEWQELADSFKGSKSKAEKDFHQLLVEKYVDEIPKIIDAKEKALQRKLLQEAPRRASDRIAYKLQQQEEEERVKYMLWQEEEDKRQKEAEERRKCLEEQRKKERDERAKERERVAEERRIEREKRAKQREEQKWAIENPELAYELKKVVDDTRPTEKEYKSTKRMKSESGDRDEDEYTAMFKVLDVLKKHKDAWPFLEAVDESYAPQYYDIIEIPMDLAKVEQKLEKSQYVSKEDFMKDIDLMFSNCLEYNGEDSCYTKMANTLERIFRKQMQREFPEDTNDSNDEDYFEDSDDPKKRKKGKKKLRSGEVFSEQASTPVKSEPQVTHPMQPDPKRLFPQMPHTGIPNGMFPAPGLRPVSSLGQMHPTDIARAQIMQQQIRLLTAMNGVLRPGAGVMPQLRPTLEGANAGFPHGLPPQLGQLGGPMASLIGQFTRMPLSGAKNVGVNSHQLTEGPSNPAGLAFAQGPVFQAIIPTTGRMEAPSQQAPPRFRMIFPPQAEVGAQNPRGFSLDHLLARSTPVEKTASTSSTVKTPQFASSQPSVRVKKEDDKIEIVPRVPEEEKDGPLTRKLSLEESNARVQSWLDSQPEAFEQDKVETPTCRAPPSSLHAPLTSTVVSSMGAAAAVAASIHNAVRQSMKATEKHENSPASHSGSVLYKKNGIVNLSKQGVPDQSGMPGTSGKEEQDKINEDGNKDSVNQATSKPQFFMYQEGKQPPSLLSPQIRPSGTGGNTGNNERPVADANRTSLPSTTHSAMSLIQQGLAIPRLRSPMPNVPSQSQGRPSTISVTSHVDAYNATRSSVSTLPGNRLLSPQTINQTVGSIKQENHTIHSPGNGNGFNTSRGSPQQQYPVDITKTEHKDLHSDPNKDSGKKAGAQPHSQQTVITTLSPQAPTGKMLSGKPEGKGGPQKEAKEKKPRKPRQKKKEVVQEKTGNTMGHASPSFGMDRQRKAAVQNEVQNILAQSAQMAGIRQLMVNQANQLSSVGGMTFVPDLTKTDSMQLGITRPIQLPGNQTFLLQVPELQKPSGEKNPRQGETPVFSVQQTMPGSLAKVPISQQQAFFSNPFMTIPTTNLVNIGTPNSVNLLQSHRLLQPTQNPTRSTQDLTRLSQEAALSQSKILQSTVGQAVVRNPQSSDPVRGTFLPVMDQARLQNMLRMNSPNLNFSSSTGPHVNNRNSTPIQNMPQLIQAMPAQSSHLEMNSSPSQGKPEKDKALPHPPTLIQRQEQNRELRGASTAEREKSNTPTDFRIVSNVGQLGSPLMMQQRGLPSRSAANSNDQSSLQNSTPALTPHGGAQRVKTSTTELSRSHSNSPFDSAKANVPFHQFSHNLGSSSPKLNREPDMIPKAVSDRPNFLDLSKSAQGKVEQPRPDLLISNERVSDVNLEKNKGFVDSRRGASVIADVGNPNVNPTGKTKTDDKNPQEASTPSMHGVIGPRGTLTVGSAMGNMGSSAMPLSLQFNPLSMEPRQQFPPGLNVTMGQPQSRQMEEMMQRRFLEHRQRMFGLPSFQAGQTSFEEGSKRNTFHHL